MSWIDEPLLGFDTETTGVDVAGDRIVTAALVLRSPGTATEIRTWLVDPGVPIPAEAAAIHGVTTAQAVAHGRAPGPALDEIATLITRHVARGLPVVAFNAAFDLSLLDAELVRHALPTLPQRLGRDVSPVLDPLVLDRALEPRRRGKRTLGALVEEYGVFDAGSLHTADVDVVATLDVLAAMAHRHPELADRSLADLHRFQISAHRDWADSFNAWRASQGFVGAGASGGWPSGA
ncbi:exonuclease domain-containing protein [Oerskovia flava]|uniref:exonuclease domain-containing protein n=1 Tax=Oerskovia flava TaxID=2986422 RepID=UPI0022402B10|nr:exonuclease domain-containing protein [Oerskovia sp. JB1-3-2]